MLKQIMSPNEIEDAVRDIAHDLRNHTNLKLWIVLDGGFMFGADLIRWLSEVDVDFVRVRRGYSRGNVKDPQLYQPDPPEYSPQHYNILVDVISETGETTKFLQCFASKGVTVVDVALIRNACVYTPWLYAFNFDEPRFLTGYGMGPHRHLPGIYKMEE